jgi:hypothetical protein
MGELFETVTIAVTSIAASLSVTRFFRPAEVLRELGRMGFSHSEDLAADELPDPNQIDAPIPRRPLRGRAD